MTEEIVTENFPNFKKDIDIYTNQKSSMNSIKDRTKNTHSKTRYNQLKKSKKREIFDSTKRKVTHVKVIPNKTISGFLNRKLREQRY